MNIHKAKEVLSVHDANVSTSTFTNVNMAQCRFDDVALQRSTFTNVNLSDVTMVDVNLTNLRIANARLVGATIDGILIDDLLAAHERESADKISTTIPMTRDAAARGAAVIYAKDVASLCLFYQAVAGLAVEGRADGHVVLGSPAFQLVLVAVPAQIAAAITIANPVIPRTETPVKLCFPVASLAAARGLAAAHGGGIKAADQEWMFQAGLACDGHDPEGNVFQLRQMASA